MYLIQVYMYVYMHVHACIGTHYTLTTLYTTYMYYSSSTCTLRYKAMTIV